MGISYYFMDKANKQVGPLSLDELKQRGITRETPVWREGMPNWVQAKDITGIYCNTETLHQRGTAYFDFMRNLCLHFILTRR